MKAKCANSRCGTITEIPDNAKKFLCSNCGCVNTPQSENSESGEEACGCILPTGFEWQLPVGRFNTPNGTLYATADDGTLLTRTEWIEAFGSDPEILKAWMETMGRDGKEGFINVSTLGRRKK
jgi:hypothetical protein